MRFCNCRFETGPVCPLIAMTHPASKSVFCHQSPSSPTKQSEETHFLPTLRLDLGRPHAPVRRRLAHVRPEARFARTSPEPAVAAALLVPGGAGVDVGRALERVRVRDGVGVGAEGFELMSAELAGKVRSYHSLGDARAGVGGCDGLGSSGRGGGARGGGRGGGGGALRARLVAGAATALGARSGRGRWRDSHDLGGGGWVRHHVREVNMAVVVRVGRRGWLC